MNLKHIQKGLLLFGLVFMLAGCASLGTYNPATGRSEFIAISTQEEIAMGQEVHRGIERSYTFTKEGKYWDRVERIGERIAQVSDRQDYMYKFFVIKKDELNAFTTPGGNIYVYTGLLDKLTKDDQLASVIAHEIGHCAAKHTVKKFQAALGYDFIGRLVLSQLDGGAAQIASLSSGALMGIVFKAYSRKDEYEADRLGVKYMYLAGYDLAGTVEALEILEKESGGHHRGPAILSTHPHLSDRVEAVKRHIKAVQERYDDKNI